MIFETAFVEVAFTLVAATIVATVGLWLRLPLVVSFIAVGVVVGPSGVGLVSRHEQVELLATVGIALLLFVVGLKLDTLSIRMLGPAAVATGVGQIGATFAIGFGLALALGMTPLTAAYIALALTFSSTIIVVKLLSDKREIDALHGRIAVGVLIVQDVAVILVMIAVTAMAGVGAADGRIASHAVAIAARSLGLLTMVALLSRFVLPRVTARLAHSQELLVLFAITWAVALGATAEGVGLSKEVGAFIAGASLASTPYRESIASRLVSLRDFLLLFFFIDLGSRIDPAMIGSTLVVALLLSTFVLLVKPAIVMTQLVWQGYRSRTSFLSGVALGQISEFSLILGTLGVNVGHIEPETLGLITAIGIITIGVSTPFIINAVTVFDRISPWLGRLERRRPRGAPDAEPDNGRAADVIVFGIGRYGGGIMRHLLLRKQSVVGVDFDPEALARWRSQGVPVVYGDASDPDLFDHLPLDTARWVVSTAPDVETSRTLLHHLQHRGYRGRVAVACRSADEGERLRVDGADLLLRPYADAAEQAVDALMAASDRLGALATATPGLQEVRLSSTSRWAGHHVADVPLRDEFGVSILAINRGGRSVFNPGPSFQLFPGDRLILSGETSGLNQAVHYLQLIDDAVAQPQEPFAVERVKVGAIEGWTGRTLADLAPSNRLGVVVLAFSEDGEHLTSPDPRRPLAADDVLILGGPPDRIVGLTARR
jgi:Kef-type K+ transport system membrane component KefB/Trk K+ transport system NAD-binding subunit